MEGKIVDVAVDYISKLPEPMLQKIMSFLLAKDAAKLSTLSKSLNSAWNSLSYLNFGGYNEFFYRDAKFVNIVNQILANRHKQKISIQKFWLKIPSSRWSSYIHSWINTLVALNIKEFILSVDTLSDDNTLPEAIFAAKDLDVLDLCGFKLELPHDGIKFSSLRVLNLSNAYLDEHLFQALCESCIGLEDLDLCQCRLASLRIAGTLPKLRSVGLACLYGLQMVDIVAPKLKSLYVDCVDVTDEWLSDIFSNLLNLEDLCLLSCRALKTIKITNDRLKDLYVSFCFSLTDIEVDAPNLLSFSCDCSDQLPTLKLKASPLLQVYLYLIRRKPLDSDWYSELMRFLGSFKQSKAIELCCNSEKTIVIPKDMRKNLLPPLYGTDCLHIEFRSAEENYSVLDVLDSLLWICPQLETLYFVRRGIGLISNLKFIYEDASDEDEKTSLPLKYCWRHKLKEVKMENFTSMEEQEELRNYLFKDEDASKMINIFKKCSLSPRFHFNIFTLRTSFIISCVLLCLVAYIRHIF